MINTQTELTDEDKQAVADLEVWLSENVAPSMQRDMLMVCCILYQKRIAELEEQTEESYHRGIERDLLT